MHAMITLTAIAFQTSYQPNVEEVFRRALAGIPGNVIYDAGNKPTPPLPFAGNPSDVTFASYGIAVARKHVRTKSVSVFRFPQSYEPTGQDQSALNAIWKLNPHDLELAFTTGLSLSKLPPETRIDLISSISLSPEIANKLYQAGDRALLKLAMGAVAHFINRRGEKGEASLYSSGSPFTADMLHASGTRTNEPIVGSLSDPDPAPENEKVALKFPNGSLMKLSALLAEAEKAFGPRYWADQRLQDEWLFVKGSYSKTQFDHLLAEVTSVDKGTEFSWDVASALNRIVKTKLPTSVLEAANKRYPSLESLLNRPTFSLDMFATFDDETQNVSKYYKLEPNSKVTMVPAIYITVNAGTPDTNYVYEINPRRGF